MPHKPGVGAIFGIVSEDGIAKDGSPVYLMDMRRDLGMGQMKLLSKQRTRPDGGFTFAGLDPSYSGYAVVATDEDGSPEKNALIQDRVQPVPAHSGSGAFGEWYISAYKAGAVTGIVPWPIQDGATTQPFGIGSMVLCDGVASQPDQIIDIPEIPPMGGISLSKYGGMVSYGRPGQPGAEFSRDISYELVIDVDSVDSSGTALSITIGASMDSYGGSRHSIGRVSGGAGYSVSTFFSHLIYDGTTKQLSLRICTSPGASPGAVIGSVSLSEYSGLVHLVVTFASGVGANFYVNSVLKNSVVTSSTIAAANYKLLYLMMVGGTGTDGFGAGCVLGPMVAYNRALSGTEVQRQYKALFSNDLVSRHTGYSKELLYELPIWYFRMHEVSAPNGRLYGELEYTDYAGASASYRALSIDDPGLLTFGLPGPILGRPAIFKSSGSTIKGIAAGVLGFPFTNQCSFTCWVNFAAQTPVIEGILAEFNKFSNSATKGAVFFALTRATDGRINLKLLQGVALSTIVFNYTPEQNKWLNIWVVVDKKEPTASTAKLYVGTESSPPEEVSSAPLSGNGVYSIYSHNGEPSLNNGACAVEIGTGMTGSLCEVALLPMAVAEGRMAEIWAGKNSV